MGNKKPVIFCVDDEKIVLNTLNSQLQGKFQDLYELGFAESGEEAIETINDLSKDGYEIIMVIADQIMPSMKGDELLVKVHQSYPKTIKILLTGQASLESAINAINSAHLFRYLTKPWPEEDFLLTVQKGLEEYSLIQSREKLLMLSYGGWISRSLYVVAKLGIPELLIDGPKTIEELANETKSHPRSLYKIMRMLAGYGVFKEEDNQKFSINDLSILLTKNHPFTSSSMTIWYGEEGYDIWEKLLEGVQTGVPGMHLALNQPLYDYYRDHPDRATLYNRTMKEKSAATIKACLQVYNFGQFKKIYDVGGGYGQFISAILDAFPTIEEGVVIDQPDVVEEAKKNYPELNQKCRFEVGDFFKKIPKGADAYLLKSILSDWADKEVIEILKCCHLAMKSKNRLLVVENILLPPNQPDLAKLLDVWHMQITPGGERTQKEYEELFDLAGFKITNIYPTATEFYIIEAIKK